MKGIYFSNGIYKNKLIENFDESLNIEDEYNEIINEITIKESDDSGNLRKIAIENSGKIILNDNDNNNTKFIKKKLPGSEKTYISLIKDLDGNEINLSNNLFNGFLIFLKIRNKDELSVADGYYFKYIITIDDDDLIEKYNFYDKNIIYIEQTIFEAKISKGEVPTDLPDKYEINDKLIFVNDIIEYDCSIINESINFELNNDNKIIEIN